MKNISFLFPSCLCLFASLLFSACSKIEGSSSDNLEDFIIGEWVSNLDVRDSYEGKVLAGAYVEFTRDGKFVNHDIGHYLQWTIFDEQNNELLTPTYLQQGNANKYDYYIDNDVLFYDGGRIYGELKKMDNDTFIANGYEMFKRIKKRGTLKNSLFNFVGDIYNCSEHYIILDNGETIPKNKISDVLHYSPNVEYPSPYFCDSYLKFDVDEESKFIPYIDLGRGNRIDAHFDDNTKILTFLYNSSGGGSGVVTMKYQPENDNLVLEQTLKNIEYNGGRHNGTETTIYHHEWWD